MVKEVLGVKDVYSVEDASLIMKKQWRTSDYLDHQDLPNGYSRQRMVEVLRLRAEYVISRGSTLNNPHIEHHFFDGMTRISDEHAMRLRQMVRDYFSNAARIDSATR